MSWCLGFYFCDVAQEGSAGRFPNPDPGIVAGLEAFLFGEYQHFILGVTATKIFV